MIATSLHLWVVRFLKIKMPYCDTNIITAFVNRPQLNKFGDKAVFKFGNEINGDRDVKGEIKSFNTTKCVVNKELLINDISHSKSAMGGILVYSNLKNVEIKKVNGNSFSTGKIVYNKLCKRHDMERDFRNKFCYGNKVNKYLEKSNKNDIRHVGSAILLREKEIITNNLKDIKPIEKVTDIKVN